MEAGQAFFLPDPDLKDEPLDEPPLSIGLSTKDLRAILDAADHSAVAATFYGPPQEKKSNEDFALTATLVDSNGERWSFAVVADGVSTKTFWPARTARIACLAALQETRRVLQEHKDGISEDGLSLLRDELAQALRYWLVKDRNSLIATAHLYPPGWDENLYRQLGNRNEYWYNSTLLVACLGPRSGFVLWAGDGGIRIIKTPRWISPGQSSEGCGEELVPLESTEDLTIGTFVSLDVTTSHFRAALISYPPPGGQVQIYLSSDGVDRTLQRIEKRYCELDLKDRRRAREQLYQLADTPGCELDNYSVAWISSPSLPAPLPLTKDGPEGQEPPRRVPSTRRRKAELKALSDGEGSPEPESNPSPGDEKAEEKVEERGPDFSLSSLRGMVLLGLVFLVGLAIGLLIHPAFARKETVAETPAFASALLYPFPLDLTPQTPLPQARPIGITRAEERALSKHLLTPRLAFGLTSWIQVLQADPSANLSVVAYRGTGTITKAHPCQILAVAAKAHAKLFLDVLSAMDPTLVSSRVKASQQVCAPPPTGSAAETSTYVSLLYLQRGDVSDCDCKSSGKSL